MKLAASRYIEQLHNHADFYPNMVCSPPLSVQHWALDYFNAICFQFLVMAEQRPTPPLTETAKVVGEYPAVSCCPVSRESMKESLRHIVEEDEKVHLLKSSQVSTSKG